MLNFTMKEFRQLCKEKELYEVAGIVQETQDNIWSEETLKDMAKQAIDRDEFGLAIHICMGIIDQGESSDSYYKFDSSAGTFCTIEGINNIQDLYEAYVDCCCDYTTYDKSLKWE